MKKTIKFTPAKLASLKHPISKQPEKWYDLGCDGLAVFVMPQPSLKISYYASWSVVTYGADGKQKRSGRYKYLGRVGGSKNLEAIKQEIVNNLPVWKAHNITTQSGKTVTSLVVEYMKSGASTGNRIKTKGTKLKYKPVTGKGYIDLLDAYVLVKTKKESTKQLLTAPFNLGNNIYYKKQLAELPLDKVTKADIEVWHNRMECIPIAANRALAALSVVFEWDSKRTTPAYTGFNPCLRIAKYQERKDKRHIDTIEKVLEVTKFLEDEQWREPHFYTFYRLQMEYGERLTDSHGITWNKPTSLVDQKKCTGWIDWRKKEIYLTDTKNREDASCELTEEMVLMLRKLQNYVTDENTNASYAAGSMWVFPRPTDPTLHINNTSYRTKLRDFNYKMGFATREYVRGSGKRKVYKYTNLLTLKHLRKTFVTYYGRSKGLEAASLRMRHSSLIVTKEHYYTEDQKALKTHTSIYNVGNNVVQLKKAANDEE
ncbi:hypothetical protein OAB71_00880 [Candidatus Pelagibacter sp.]|nr:hypothetical protein [Candidatus Pelagibacter sp.]